MRRLIFAILALLSTPALVGAAEEAAKMFKFEPTKSISTFGMVYTVLMVVKVQGMALTTGTTTIAG